MKDIVIPELAESILSGTISAWLVNEGDMVQEGDPLIELETDKIMVEVNAENSGVITEKIKDDLEDVEVGEVVGRIDENSIATAPTEDSQETEQVEENNDTEQAEEKEGDSAISSLPEKQHVDEKPSTKPEMPPAERKKRREEGRTLSEKEETTPPDQKNKQIEKENKFSEEATKPMEKPEEIRKPATIERFSRRRRTIAARLVEAQQTMAMLTTFNEVDMTNIMALRKELQDEFVEKHGTKLGFMSFFVKGVVGALKKFPAVNSELRGDELILKEYYDIGVAVSTEEGLVVPVVEETDKKNFAQIEEKVNELAEKARDGKLTLEEMQGGTFTITNGGVFGSTFSTPIINMPQAAILGMHNIVQRPVGSSDGSVEVRPMMQVALTYDHRIIDGKVAASFLTYLSELLSDPKKLLLEG